MLLQLISNIDVFTILTFIIVLLVSYIIWNYFFSVRINIPGPRPWPIIGNIPNLAGTKDIGAKFLEYKKKYGDMVLLRLGPQPFVVCFGAKIIRETLVVNGEKTKFRPYWFYLLRKVIPTHSGIFFSNGESWSDGRKFTVVALKDFGVGKKSIDERIHEEIQYLIDDFSNNPNKPVDAGKVFPLATANVISNIVFGSRFDYDDPEFLNLIHNIRTFFKTATVNSPINFFPFLAKIHPNNPVSEAIETRRVVCEYVKKRIEKERETFDPENLRSFVDLYLKQEGKEDSKISEEFLFQVINDLYQAGTDTTAVTVQWGLLYMLVYPDVQQKCREEILSVIGDERYPGFKDKEKLPYVMATIYEIQRLASIAPIAVPHTVLEDTYIAGKLIPKKTILLNHLMSSHYDPTVWENPEEFHPERFLNAEGKAFKPDGFCPFSMGPRTCIGMPLAMNEIFIFFTSLLQRFNFTKVKESDVLSTEGNQTGITRLPNSFEMLFKPR